MPCRPRNPVIFDDQIVHVFNRGNARQDLFTKDADFALSSPCWKTPASASATSASSATA